MNSKKSKLRDSRKLVYANNLETHWLQLLILSENQLLIYSVTLIKAVDKIRWTRGMSYMGKLIFLCNKVCCRSEKNILPVIK